MPFALQAHFDPATDDFVRRLWQTLLDAGIPCRPINKGHVPHLTFLYGDTKTDKLSLVNLKSPPAPIPVSFLSPGTFGPESGAIHLPALLTPGLLDWHRLLVDSDNFAVLDPLYATEAWQPHCTLASRLDQFAMIAAIGLLSEVPFPVEGFCLSLSLVTYPDARVLDSVPLI